MNIIFYGNFLGVGWDGSITDENHIADALENFDCNVYKVQREDNSTLANFPADFILLAQWDGYPEDLLTRLKYKYNCPIVYWAFDYQADGQAWHERLVNQSDLYLSKRIADSKYPHWQWLSQDFTPNFLEIMQPNLNKDIDILFTGSYLPWATERNETLKAVDERYNLVIYSVKPDQWKEKGFKNVNGPAMDYMLPKLISRAKINLSIDHTIEAGYWSDRNAQIMACGGFVLFRHVPLSTAIFKSNIVYFYDKESCFTQ